MRRDGLLVPLVVGTLVAFPLEAACPKLTVTVDNDTPGSGYSESPPDNFASHDVDACKGTYRYTTKYSGDGSAKGKATWKPTITVAGTYAVKSGYRGSVNRTNSADYYAYGDDGKSTHVVVNQTSTDGCTYADLGMIYCKPGGTCRAVLDANDALESAAADVTTFELVSCDMPAPSVCDAIASHATWELCAETATTCAGVFGDGAGCQAFCAAAGMVCTGHFGASPGCMKEPANTLPCNATGNQNDWCECAFPPGAGGAAGAAGGPSGGWGGGPAGTAGMSASTGGVAGTGGASAGVSGGASAGASGVGGSAGTAGGSGFPQGASGTTASGTAGVGTSGFPSKTVSPTTEPEGDAGGCGCSAPSDASAGGTALALAAMLLARRRRGR